MLAKTNSLQQQARRTPLSLGTSTKTSKTNEKNDNSKKETPTNQKTENLKKDSQLERKPSTDKKQSLMDSKRSSSTSSTDSRKLEDNKNNKNEDNNKKSQNGVNGNNSKSKQSNGNETVAKTKPESTSNGNTSKKDTQKSVDKKKDATVIVVDEPTDKETIVEKTKDTKNEENKGKASDKNKDKTAEKDKPKEVTEDGEKKQKIVKIDEEKPTISEVKPMEQEVTVVAPENGENEQKKGEEISVLKTPVKENKNKNDETTTTTTVAPEVHEVNLLDDVEMMEPLKFIEEPNSCSVFAVSTPAKTCSPKEALNLFEAPSSKPSPKSEIKPTKETLTHTPDRKSCPRSFSAISGRRSIRPIGDYTFSGNLQIRESYRKINTELDFTSSSLNVTVGSEVPNNESFSFFSRSRKRDRSSPTPQSAMEVQNDLSPKSPKRAKIDGGAMYGFLNVMASPITMLRARLARASVQSTPKKQIIDEIEQEIVENVSAIAVEAIDEEITATEEQTFNPDSTVADTNEQPEEPAKCSVESCPAVEAVEDVDDIKIKETITATDSQAKKRCSIM